MDKRPNILYLMSDEHRADLAGFAGNDVVRTPNLDNLSETGIVFKNAYTPSPICVPARMCMMSGQLPKTCSCEGWKDLKPGYRTFAHEFSKYAYNTVASGKLHHLGTDQMQGWRTRLAPDAEISDEYISDIIIEEFSRYKPAPGKGKWSNQREVEEARPAEGPYQIFDKKAVRATLDYLERYFRDELYLRPQSHRPLLFKLSLIQPHYPYFTKKELFDYYLNRVPIFLDEPCDHPVLSLSQHDIPVKVSETSIRRATAAYYGMVETVDNYFGQVLDILKSLGEDIDDWIIIYTSDHGEMLGQHGLWEKGRFYEGSVHVPLIIRWPSQFDSGIKVTENVNLCDLYATICDLADIPIPENLDSRSMLPLMKGNNYDWNNETVSQFGKNHIMIKRDHLKYQYYGEEIPEVLFNLELDPSENINFAEDDEYNEAMRKFRTRLSQLGHGSNANKNYKNAGYEPKIQP
jgi:choline-sulfatase